MQFLILFIGVSVFVFYQFNLSPINFNTAALEKVRNSKFNTEFEILEQKHEEIQEEKFSLMKTFSKSKQRTALLLSFLSFSLSHLVFL